MSRTALIAVIAAAVIVVGALAVITPTVIVDEHHDRHGVRVRVVGGDWMPFPGKPGQGPGQRFRRGFAPPLPGR